MNKLVSSFTLAFILLSVMFAFLEGGGGMVATKLTLPMSISSTNMTVISTAGYMNNGVVFVESEKIGYSNKTATTLSGLLRGYEGTTARAHSTGKVVYNEPAGVINAAMGFNVAVLAASNGWLSMITIPFNFFTITLPRLVLWDFPIFYGDWIVIRYVLMALSIGFYIAFVINLGTLVAYAIRR